VIVHRDHVVGIGIVEARHASPEGNTWVAPTNDTPVVGLSDASAPSPVKGYKVLKGALR